MNFFTNSLEDFQPYHVIKDIIINSIFPLYFCKDSHVWCGTDRYVIIENSLQTAIHTITWLQIKTLLGELFEFYDKFYFPAHLGHFREIK